MTLLLLFMTTTVAWAQHSPTLSVEACEGKHGSLYVKGWCEDPDDISIPLTVEVHILDADHNHVQGSPIRLTANVRRFGSDNQWHNNGFDNYIPITTAATYRVAIYANDATGDANTIWNDYLVQVPVSAPYTVTYNANGGSGAPASQMKHHGIDLTLSNTVPTRSGQTFARWSTKADGTGTNYDRSGTYSDNADVTLYAIWGNSVPYLAYSTYYKRFENKLASSPIPVSSITTSMGTWGQESWYMVTGNVTIDSRIEVNGYVNLILCDGATLTAMQGIAVNEGGCDQSLSIFGQTAGTGTLNAYGVKITADGSAAIGSTGGNNHVFGKVFIHGGVINADGTEWTAGIGGGVNQGGGRVELLGGTISARGHKGLSQAVGKGSGGANVERYIADGLRVTVGDNTTPVNKDDRVNALNSVDVWVKASPCTNHSVTNHVCNYCGMTCYSVTYDQNSATSGTVPSTTFYQNNANVTVPGNTGNLTRQGYTFTGWNKRADGNGYNYTSGEVFQIQQDVTLYAKWTLNTYTVHFDKNHSDATGTMNDQSFTYNTAQNLTANGFSRIGYDFMGWSTTPNGSVAYTNGQSVNNLTNQNGAVVNLYAVWQLNTYSITYNLDGGSVATPNPTSYTVQSNAITLVNPTREGYTFTGWTGTGLNSSTMTVTIPHGSVGDRSYKATWTLTYTISYDLAGGSVPTPNPATYTEVSSNITLVNPTRDGYTFAGWTGTDLDEPTISVTIANGSTGNRSYTATWVPNYNLTYDLAGGTASNPTYYCVLSDDITLNNPIRTGYTFAGWTGTDLDGPTMIVTIPHGSEGDRSYTATWTLDVYTIGYDLAGGSVETENPTSYTYLYGDITLVNPTREGYYFVGWTGTGLTEPTQNVTITAGSTGNRSYTAVWTLIYTISYDGLVEGTFPSEPPTTYTVLSETFTLVNPVRDLYDFAGWTGTGLTQPTMIVTIPKGSTGNRSYTATWSLKEGQYVSYNPETGEYEAHAVSSPLHLESTSATTIGTANQVTWYMVKDAGVIAYDRLTVRGTVNLILADGASMTARKGITVHYGNTLNIYGQAGGTGSLNATASGGNHAGIGTEGNNNGDKVLGTITIYGGTITATGADWSAGIGGGVGCGGGNISIYGGTISATASSYGNPEAIGRGSETPSTPNVGRIIADGLRVYVGDNTTPVNYGNRISSLNNRVVRVEPCTEHNWNGSRCTYCGAYRYHQMTYNGNGNTGGTIPAVATCNVTTGIHTATGTVANAGSLERTGYSFTGWNTEADGSGTAYEPDETVILRSSITLYAQWTPIQYTITYDLAGGYEPTIPNPISYTIESGDIILNNPTRVDIDEVNGTTTNYLFMGWTGTGLGEATKTVTIPHGSMGDRTYTATWDVSDIPFEGIEIDHDYAEGEVGRYYIKMPVPEHDEEGFTIQADEDFPVRTVAIPEWFTSSFKVYDNGGKNTDDGGDYMANPDGDGITTLILIAPEGKVFSVRGGIAISTWYGDWLKIYDGATTEHEVDDIYTYDEYGDLDELIIPFVTTGNSIRFDLYAEDEQYQYGLDLTVSVIDAPIVLNLVENSLTPWGATVSWTGPSENYVLEIAEGTPDSGESSLDWTTVDNATSPYTFDNLNFETTYSVRVIGTTEGQSDKISNILSFTTLERHPVPTNLEIVENSLTAYGATVNWRGFSDNYNIKLEVVNYLVNADFETGNLSQAAFTTTSDYLWTVVENNHSGSWCAKSTNQNIDSSVSDMVLEVTLDDDKTLTFSAKVSSEDDWDKAYFSIDGTNAINGISGDGDWIDYTFPLTAGTHTLRWDYTKDDGTAKYDDCFYVDDIRIIDGFTEVGNYRSNTNSYTLTGLSAGTTYEVQVQADGGAEGISQWSDPIMFTTTFDLILANAADNSDAIRMAATNGGEFKVTLADRTLYKDGDWNTLCLPFNLSAEQIAASSLADAEIRTLNSASLNDSGTLTLNFTPATGEGAVTELVAGTPYIIRWTRANDYEDDDEHNLVNPMFTGVTVDATMHDRGCNLGDGKSISLVGNYSPVVYAAGTAHKDVLFLGSGSTLYYPDGTKATTINACRAYFQLNGITAGDPENGVKAFVLNFGEVIDQIDEMKNERMKNEKSDDAWYDLQGRKMKNERMKNEKLPRGIYIHNGKKVVIK